MAHAPAYESPIPIDVSKRQMPEKTTELCSWAGCGQPARSSLLDRLLCLEHFLQLATSRLGSIQNMVDESSEGRTVSPDVQTFLSQVISQTTTLAMETHLLHPGYREALLTLSTQAAELYRRIHRESRIAWKIPCRIRGDAGSGEVVVTCTTLNISRQGACVETNLAVRVEQHVTLERTDTGKTARTRVKWVKSISPGAFIAGLEILDHKDFWGLEVRAHAKPRLDGRTRKTG